MYCPKCRYEYRDGIETCPNCEVELVHLLPDLPEPVRTPRLPYLAVGAIAATILLYIFRTAATFDPMLIDSTAKAIAVDVFLLLTRVTLLLFFVYLAKEWMPVQSGRAQLAVWLMVGYHALVALLMVRGLFWLSGIDIWPQFTAFYEANPLSAKLGFAAGFAVGLLFYASVYLEKGAELSRPVRAASLLAGVGMVAMLYFSIIVLIIDRFGPVQMMIMLPVAMFGVFAEAYFFSRFVTPKEVPVEEPPVSATVA